MRRKLSVVCVLLLVVIVALIAELVVQRGRAADREAELRARYDHAWPAVARERHAAEAKFAQLQERSAKEATKAERCATNLRVMIKLISELKRMPTVSTSELRKSEILAQISTLETSEQEERLQQENEGVIYGATGWTLDSYRYRFANKPCFELISLEPGEPYEVYLTRHDQVWGARLRWWDELAKAYRASESYAARLRQKYHDGATFPWRTMSQDPLPPADPAVNIYGDKRNAFAAYMQIVTDEPSASGIPTRRE